MDNKNDQYQPPKESSLRRGLAIYAGLFLFYVMLVFLAVSHDYTGFFDEQLRFQLTYPIIPLLLLGWLLIKKYYVAASFLIFYSILGSIILDIYFFGLNFGF